MHNCRETREQLTELLLDGVDCGSDEVLLADLNRCDECRAEFDALNATLRVTTRLREAAAPAPGYWLGYHARLRERLSRAKTQRRKEGPQFSFAALRLGASTAFVRFLRSSIAVPVPLGLAVIILCSVLGLFAFRFTERQTLPAQSPIIVHVPIEVPVIHEKPVIQLVYRERRPPLRSSKRITVGPTVENAFARSQKPPNEETPASLVGFKPTDEIKLTVIKGGSPNEK